MSNVIKISDVKNDNRFITPMNTLCDAMDDIASEKKKPTKLIVLMLDDADGKYDMSFYASNLKASEVVALFEIQKDVFVRMIND